MRSCWGCWTVAGWVRGGCGSTARPVVAQGCAELVAAGAHREAMFWVVATFARCHAILAADAPEREVVVRPAFEAALADLGVASVADRRRRADEVLAALPGWCAVADAMVRGRVAG